MFKKIGLAAMFFVALFLVAGLAMAQEATEHPTEHPKATAAEVSMEAAPAVEAPVNVGNKVCPVTGEKVSGADTVEYEGKVYNLCCPMCKEEFLKDPAKYIAKVEAESAMGEEAVVEEGAMPEGHMHE